jgi:nucleotide-binding universal stress UspA family protein
LLKALSKETFMRRVLVPLDGTSLAEAIVSDAIRLAGCRGQVVLFQAVTLSTPRAGGEPAVPTRVSSARAYLQSVADRFPEVPHPFVVDTAIATKVPDAILDAVDELSIDMVAMGTHGRAGVSRLLHGGIAWSVLARSHVPVMMRHGASAKQEPERRRRTLLVPTDGSHLAGAALPLGMQLAWEWHAEVLLAEVTPEVAFADQTAAASLGGTVSVDTGTFVEQWREDAERDLTELSTKLNHPVRVIARSGNPVDELCRIVDEFDVTDVVLASRGRTGFSRAVLGSTADGLVHRLDIPVILVPTRCADLRERATSPVAEATAGPVGGPSHRVRSLATQW